MNNGTDRKIVVMTPVRNEAWILPRFLQVTEKFADLIIILDQSSTDGSIELCRNHPKVLFIENRSLTFNEAERQNILIDAARKAVPGPRVLLALDADEIIAADAITSDDWQRGMNAPPGTVLQIEKPTFINTVDTVIRYPGGFPLGLVDDDSPHNPRMIHSVRIPTRADSPLMRMEQVKALHYALMRPAATRAKHRLYSAIENVARSRHVFARRYMYDSQKNYTSEGPVEATPPQWLRGWEEAGIDMRTIPENGSLHWQNIELLRLMAQHGERRFWMDDIWDEDLETMRIKAISQGMQGLPTRPISAPPKLLHWSLKIPDLIYKSVQNKKSNMRLVEFRKRMLTNPADERGIETPAAGKLIGNSSRSA